MKKIVLILSMLFPSSMALANEIYIDQSGNNLDLTVTQSGTGNVIGTSAETVILEGDDMTFDITQTGDDNIIHAVIKGNTYTGLWSFTGNSNTVDLTCDETSGVNCETVTMNITVNGDSNTFQVYLGETADTSDLIAEWVVDGDSNAFVTNINGASVHVDITVDNSVSMAGGNTFNIDITGDGDATGHELVLDVTGGGSTYDIDQSGNLDDNIINITQVGDNAIVTISQSN